MVERAVFTAAEIGTLYQDDERSLSEKYGLMVTPHFRVEVSDQNDDILYSAEAIYENGSFDLDGLIISDIEWEEDIEGADSLKLTVQNPDLTLQDSRLFAEGNSIDLFVAYDGRPEFFMGRGIIVEIEPEFPADTMPTIRLVAYDKSYFMMEEGRAEIVPEGSEWYERRQERAQQFEPLNTVVVRNNAYSDRDLDEEDIADRERFNSALSSLGGEDNFLPTIGPDEVDAEGIDRTISEVRQESVPSSQFDVASLERALQDHARSNIRYSWQRQRFPRRQRQAGNVWRGKTDSEIVAAIFQSYGITPYVEATNERRRVARGRRRPNDQPIVGGFGERSGRPSPAAEGVVQGVDGEVVSEDVRRVMNWQGDDDDLRSQFVQDYEDFNDPGNAEAVANLEDFNAVDGTDVWANITSARLEAPMMVIGSDGLEAITGTFESDSDDIFADDLRYMPVEPEPEATPTQAPSNNNRPREVTQRAGTTDWDFITSLAKQHGFITFVFFHYESRRWIGYWGPEENIPQDKEFIFRYNSGDDSSLGVVRPSLSMRNQSTEIDLIYVDPVNRKTNRLRVSMENVSQYSPEFRGPDAAQQITEPVGDGPQVTLMIHGQRVQTHSNRRFANAEDARNWLLAFWLRHAQEFLLIEGETIIGIPEMRARQRHQFQGIGRYAGRFFVTLARHKLGGGARYQTMFTGRRVVDFNQQDDPGDDLFVLDQTNLGESEPESETT